MKLLEPQFEKLKDEIKAHESNAWARELGYDPLFSAGSKSKIVVVGQAPGIRAQVSMKPWNDPSVVRLRSWMNISNEDFYNPELVSLIPMDFYFPGKGKGGDLPPRKGFAEKWHPRLLELMPKVELIILAGLYSHSYYLGKDREKTITETVRNYKAYLPKFIALPHPSPRNIHWFQKNPWFEAENIAYLRKRVKELLK